MKRYIASDSELLYVPEDTKLFKTMKCAKKYGVIYNKNIIYEIFYCKVIDCLTYKKIWVDCCMKLCNNK
jgi:hypothetical protein